MAPGGEAFSPLFVNMENVGEILSFVVLSIHGSSSLLVFVSVLLCVNPLPNCQVPIGLLYLALATDAIFAVKYHRKTYLY